VPKSKEERREEAPEHLRDSELWNLPAVNEDIITRLDGAGIHTFEGLYCAAPSDLIGDRGVGITEERYEALMKQVRPKVDSMRLMKAGELGKAEYIQTGSTKLDELIGGGYKMGEITELASLWGLAKTTLCITAMATCWQQYKSPSIYCHTEIQQPFDIDFPKRLAAARGITDWDVEKNLYYIKPISSDEQMWAARNADSMIKRTDAKLYVVDSLGGHFRAEYPGQGWLATRQQLIRKYLMYLSRLASIFNIAVIVTNQVHADPQSSAQIPTLGHIHHNVGKILIIRNVGGAKQGGQYKGVQSIKSIHDTGMREVTLYKALGLPPRACLIQITDSGVTDIGEQ
jgi:DNA repair protein RadA